MDPYNAQDPVTFLSTGDAALDEALGGGLTVGRIVEVYGLAAFAVGEVVARIIGTVVARGPVLVVNTTTRQATVFGDRIQTTGRLVACADALDQVEQAARLGGFAMVVLDSVPGLVDDDRDPAGEVDGQSFLSPLARRMSRHLRQVVLLASRTGTTLLYVNRTDDRGRTAGGNGLRYYASARIEVARVLRAKVVKNRVAPPFRVAYLPEPR